MAHGTVATRTLESIEKELEKRVAKDDSFAWYVFKQLDEYDRADLLERVRYLSIAVKGMGIYSAFQLIFKASVYQALHNERPWLVHDLRKESERIARRNKYYSNGGSE